MVSKRDEFDESIKDILAKRVGNKCANPNCRKPTFGPQVAPDKTINVGVAAHITAAAKNGKRYDPNLSSNERKSVDNGIWLCQTCGKLIDSDPQRYTVEVIRAWRSLSEQAALLDLENRSSIIETSNDDIDIIRFYSQCFDRPAFQDEFLRESSTEAFDKAIEDTITALNTGCLRARDGQVLNQSQGKSYITNVKWRQKMDAIVDLLRALRARYSIAVQTGQIHLSSEQNGRQFHFINDSDLVTWMDVTRTEIISLFSEICEEAGIPKLEFPRGHMRRQNW